jgi:deferrochelatase/peroxidase EfeB
MKSSRRSLLGNLGKAAAIGLAATQARPAFAQAATPLPGHAGAHDFHGPTQPGILTPQQPHATVMAFNCLAENRAALQRLFRILTDRGRFLMRGGPNLQAQEDLPPADSG